MIYEKLNEPEKIAETKSQKKKKSVSAREERVEELKEAKSICSMEFVFIALLVMSNMYGFHFTPSTQRIVPSVWRSAQKYTFVFYTGKKFITEVAEDNKYFSC